MFTTSTLNYKVEGRKEQRHSIPVPMFGSSVFRQGRIRFAGPVLDSQVGFVIPADRANIPSAIIHCSTRYVNGRPQEISAWTE
jgi:hypothetical protein